MRTAKPIASRLLRKATLIASALGALSVLLPAAESPLPVPFSPAVELTLRTFFATYCKECHGPEKQKGDRRFDQLALVVAKPETLIDLQDIIDQLNLGEMPPAEAKQQPPAPAVRDVVKLLTQLVSDGQTRFASTGGRTILRRLNRREYINTVGDLFGLNMTMFDPTTKFPRDQMVLHFDNIGDALKTSGYLLAEYIDAAEQVVEKAFGSNERPREQTWRFAGNFQQQPELRYSHDKVHQFRYLCLYETATSVQHEGAYGPLLEFAQGVPADGIYEIRVKAEAMHRKNPYDSRIFGAASGPPNDVGRYSSSTDPEMPFRLGVVPGTAKAGALHLPQPIEPQLGEVILRDDGPEWYLFKVWLDAGHSPRFTFPNGMLSVRSAYGRILRQYNAQFPEDVRATTDFVESRVVVMRHGQLPHIRIHEVEIHGPLVVQWPSAGRQTILGAKPFAAERTREILENFARRAYRRPTLAEEVDRLMSVVASRVQQGRAPFDALKDAFKAALCSAAFLYLVEPGADPAAARWLDAHALATRLSYFFWSSMPDAELSRLADTGELLNPEVLVTQTRRLLASPRVEVFVASFLDSWLNLRSLGDMAPDRGTFVGYYAQNLQGAMKRETQLFTRDLLDRNVTIVRFLDSDYTFVNRPLARLYGLETAVDAATGHEFRRINFTTPQRGGLLGHGSVLTVSANGVETSPVIRGVWLLENILGTPPAPPPDNVPPIDPDIRGAKSMREILLKHRDTPSCFECHRKIDPPGFALENYDPIGAWRARYLNGESVESSGELPGGQAFHDIAGLKKILVGRKAQFARMLTERLLNYACGRRMEALDRPAVDGILDATRADDYRFRDLIEQVVLSPAFRSK